MSAVLQMSLFRQGKTTKDIHDLLRLLNLNLKTKTAADMFLECVLNQYKSVLFETSWYL